MWLKENRPNLEETHINSILKRFNYRKFVNYKIDGNYKECLNIFLNPKKKLLNLKNLIIFLLQLEYFYLMNQSNNLT